MLETLHRIVKEVNAASDLEQALAIIVQEVKQAVQADVCSVYLTDFERRDHVLKATDGLHPQAVDKVRLPYHRGLIGLVCERAEPVNLADAPNHKRYLFTHETGETSYKGFLGVPIIQNRKVLGVLVARQIDQRSFEDNEVTFLFTLAAQLAGAITHAQASGNLNTQSDLAPPKRFLQGQPGSPGVALGTAVVVYPPADLEAVPDRPSKDPDEEEDAFRTAVAAVVQDLMAIEDRFEESLPAEDRALFEAWLMMLGSDSLIGNTVRRIQQGNWAPGALRETFQEHARIFENMEDIYLRERASDVLDLGRRILMHLQQKVATLDEYPENTILVGEEVSAMQLAEVPRERLAGVVSASGASFSHVAILARALEVPAVMGMSNLPVSRMEGHFLILEGYLGRIYVSPAPSVIAEYRRLASEDQALYQELQADKDLPCETTDGVRIPLYLNTGLLSELSNQGMAESEGVGLYRTELPFMVRDSFPGESVQVANYRKVLKMFHPRPVIIRTLDIGGDKPLPYFPVEESNPFLGWRGIRISLDHPEIFITQVRAILRAAIDLNNLRLLLPMISHVQEVDDAMLLIQRAHDELLEEGYQVKMPKVGVMIEVPAAVYQVEALAQRIDFLSVGTNDLTQYLLAVDRNNAHVADIYNDLHPAVLRALIQIIKGAGQYGKEVSVCGELAGNPAAAVLLLGMGVNSLSMNGGSLLRVKWVLRSFSHSRAKQLLQTALRCEQAGEIVNLLSNALEEMGLGGLMRAGR
ncbi:MAG: phosphoenolpyruvate--protein phosphotransferase [Candidatus Thiodiazotropha lotti]|uniref:phosphoenolpyruvate--protein phosphotransferase n=1 Tax=Candidatus Thiodiazotropha endoloripes TaxID=1818881 RepID=A0A1E2ULC9_9GAMM|nr:phosphoenolpyruvate--protein phosphotransferase [Candidatus Thiodiazotropha endoloripes]MCG7903337.1 phosphoenolpyruvate--protein phosphotransferase [Candidatus Thiodiazotropha weberae]MCG7992187.1 phosphoenolpyruvate--protein phosphotransferase [Candidatus Thiodiazotropha lotti]MCG7915299.1 phosphoenolpyruvate--protein phosphotransferase [Candidatus Thiodiazotropha weberae]MCG7998692.1 phosphoenolpyruvate--protein phosphotransferase [Candidatus Thiodiazotropha lotti]MCW4183845.1 phosphoeno